MEKSKVPLLEPAWPPADIDRRSSAGGDEGEEEGLGRRLVEENRKLWVVAGPSICTRFSTFGLTIISQAFIGHIGPTELAAYALVSTVLMRFSIDVLFGNVVQHHIGPPDWEYEECTDCTRRSFHMVTCILIHAYHAVALDQTLLFTLVPHMV
uniref:Protein DETOXIFICATION n=1 Tax=Aegilops tauschii subsp. strangulata TaxID=200361 RepID=A0A453HPW9_AEGTS